MEVSKHTFDINLHLYLFARRRKTVTVEARLVDLERKLERRARENSQKLEEVKTTEQRLEQKLDRILSLLENFEAKELSLNTNLY